MLEGGGELEEVVSFRLFSNVRTDVQAAVKDNPTMFENESHFYRVATMKLLREINHV
jgi:hypothetical protein